MTFIPHNVKKKCFKACPDYKVQNGSCDCINQMKFEMDKTVNEIDIPNAYLEKSASITYEERDKLLHFNTDRFWHCFFDVKTKRLYNEYCRLIMDDAYSYLLNLGLIDKDMNQLEYFEQ